MKTDKFVLINDLRVKYCKPCTTANSCAGCLVDVMEEALRASQQNAHMTGWMRCPKCQSMLFSDGYCPRCEQTHPQVA